MLLRRIIAITLICVISTSLCFGAVQFEDTANHWGEAYIKAMSDRNIVTGYQRSDGKYEFKPEGFVTYEEATTMFYRTIAAANKLTSESDHTSEYLGMLENYKIAPWAHKYVSYGLKNSMIEVGELSKFTQDNGYGYAAPREDIAAWAAKVLPHDTAPAYILEYGDLASIDANKLPYIDLVYRHEIMSGDNLGNFNPKAMVKRVELSTICTRLLASLAKSGYETEHEVVTIEGTVKSFNLVTREIVLTSGGKDKTIVINPSTEVVINQEIAYNSYNDIKAGAYIKVSCGTFKDVPQIHVETSDAQSSYDGIISKVDKIEDDYFILSIANSKNEKILYLQDKNTKVSANLESGESVTFKCDGVILTEIK